MNKNKTADFASLRSYLLSDRRYLVQSADRRRGVKRHLRRMNRRNQKSIAMMEATE
jgi:hypothetical protein